MFETKPCFYCGSDDVIVSEGKYAWFARCCSCGAFGFAGSTMEEAVKKWNDRSWMYYGG